MTKTICSEKCELIATKRSVCILLLTALAFLMASGFRLGLTVTVGGKALPGIYRPFEIIQSVKAAEDAASEILWQPVSIEGGLSVRPGLCSKGLWGDTRALQRSLLEQVSGIIGLYAVKIDGERIGWVKDQSELGEMLEVLLSESCQAGTVSAGFIQTVTAEYSYAPEWSEVDSVAVSKSLRDSLIVEVVNVEPYSFIETSA